MNVAITVWDNRISPVFDSAETLLIARSRESEIVDRQTRLFQAGMFDRFVQLLSGLDVQVLICGALCAGPACILEAQGVNVISFMAGDAEEILDHYVQGGCMVPVQLLAEHKVQRLVVGGIGMRPLMGFKQVGIDVYYDGERQEIRPVVLDMIAGVLPMIGEDQVCGGSAHV